jgi:hypothetical protein
VFLYAGNFYGLRTAGKLIEGFALFLKGSPGATLVFAGTDPSAVMPHAERLGVAHSVRILPFTRDIRAAFRSADVLVAVDSSAGAQVFLSTKLVEYCVVDRFVLLVGPPHGPGVSLLERFPDTAVTAGEDPEAISRAMTELSGRAYDRDLFLKRFSCLRDFSASSVTETLQDMIRKKAGDNAA